MTQAEPAGVTAGPITRLGLAFAALGAATIHFAVAAATPLPVALVLFGCGVAGLCWGGATLVAGRILAPRAALGGALAPVFAWAGAVALGTGHAGTAAHGAASVLPLFPMATAELLGILLAVVLAALLRRPAPGLGRENGEPAAQGWRFVVAVIIGGVLFSGLVTSAVAAALPSAPHSAH